MTYCRNTNLVLAHQWVLDLIPDWIEDAIKSGQIKVNSSRQATVAGVHITTGQWVVLRGKKLMVYGDKYFKKHFVRVP